MDLAPDALAEANEALSAIGESPMPAAKQAAPASSSEEPSTAPAPTPAPQKQAASTEPWWKQRAEDVIEYDVNGKPVKEPLSMILRRAGLGYHYSQKVHETNELKSKSEQALAQAQDMEKRWKAYDDYARQNPDWARHVQTLWENRNNVNQAATGEAQEGSLDPRVLQHVNSLQSKIAELEANLGQVTTHFKTVQEKQADDAYQAQVESIRKVYPDIDFQVTDPDTGKSLEYKVLEFAQAQGIRDFGIAFKAYYSDQLVARAREQAKESTAKGLAQQKKEGILTKPATPQPQGITRAKNVRAKSYQTLEREALEELAAMGAQI